LFQSLLGLILPFASEARASARLWALLRLVVHVVLVAAVVAGLHWLNNYEPWRLWEKIRVHSDFLRRNWLPILFLLVHALGWLSWWLYKVLTQEEQDTHYPDIDQAWEEALGALRKAGLRLTDLPLFLVLGRPEEDERALFQAAGLALEVKGAPDRPEAPLHLY